MIQNMVNRKINFFSLLYSSLSLFLLCYATYCNALQSDRERVLTLVADSADLNQENRCGIYKGDVQLDQGSTHVRAAKAITKGNEHNKLKMAKAMGNQLAQAHYWSTPEEGKPPVHAFADEIYYYPEKHLIKLIGNARIEQGVNSFSAPEIVYDTEKQHVVTQKHNQARTKIIIHPEKH